MRAIKSFYERLLSKYYAHQDDYVGVSYFFRLYTYCKLLDMLLYKQKFNREEIITINRKFNNYWEMRVNREDTQQELANLFIFAKSKTEYIYNFIKKYEGDQLGSSLDTSQHPLKWIPLCWGVEKI